MSHDSNQYIIVHNGQPIADWIDLVGYQSGDLSYVTSL